MPTSTRETNSRAASPSRVKMATPLPYSWSLGSARASSKSLAWTMDSTGPKISSVYTLMSVVTLSSSVGPTK